MTTHTPHGPAPDTPDPASGQPVITNAPRPASESP